MRSTLGACAAYNKPYPKVVGSKRERAGGARPHDLWFWMPAPFPYPTPTCWYIYIADQQNIMIHKLKCVAYVDVWKRHVARSLLRLKKTNSGEARTRDLWFWTPAPYHYTTPTCCIFLLSAIIWFMNWTKHCRSEWCRGKALAFKTIGRGFAPRKCFLFFTRRRRRRVSIYQSYIGKPLPTCSFLSPLRAVWSTNWNASPTSWVRASTALCLFHM